MHNLESLNSLNMSLVDIFLNLYAVHKDPIGHGTFDPDVLDYIKDLKNKNRLKVLSY